MYVFIYKKHICVYMYMCICECENVYFLTFHHVKLG